jgi:hypothetical protein
MTQNEEPLTSNDTSSTEPSSAQNGGDSRNRDERGDSDGCGTDDDVCCLAHDSKLDCSLSGLDFDQEEVE